MKAVLNSKIFGCKTATALWLFSALWLSNAQSQELPQQCLQLPERTTVCENLLYKLSPVDLPAHNVKAGAIVCICMSDFNMLRIAADDEQEKVNQIVELSRMAVKLDVKEQDFIDLLRK